MKKILLFIIVIAIAALVVFLASPGAPVIEVPTPITTIGQATPVLIRVHARRGIRSVSAGIEQNGVRYPIWASSQGSSASESGWQFNVGVADTPQLKDGKAKLTLEAVSNGLLHRTGRWEREVSVITRAPTVSVDSDQHYLYLGMADIVTFSVSGTYTQAGVRVGDQTYRAWPMPDGKPGLFSLFAFAWNMPQDTVPVAFASYGGGNDVTSPISVQFPKKEQPKYTVHNLNIDDRFIQKVVNELDPNGSGDMVSRFLRINGEMRRANNKTLADLRLKTAGKFLWSQPFIRQPHAQTAATFADLRNYMYQGK